MKAILICPGERNEVAALSETVPLSNLTFLGKTLIEYWLEDLAVKGAKEVCVLATDRPEQVRALVGGGARWGLRVEVLPEIRELTAAEARVKYYVNPTAGWLPVPMDTRVMDHLPGLPEFPLFTSYADWMAAQRAWLPHVATPDRIGVHEIRPGIWAGLHTKISPEAELHAPCWIGDEVFIGPRAVIGPMAVLERRALVERGAVISHSYIGPETFVGEVTELHNSIALGSTLTNWKLNSSIKVSDAYLLCSLARHSSAFKPVGVFSRIGAVVVLLATLPFALFPMAWSAFRGLPIFRKMVAVRPRTSLTAPPPGDGVIYYELANFQGWLRRWPQLWSIIRGDFAWVGNRPLTPHQAVKLTNEFERLWLTARLGLISLADMQGIYDAPSNDARGHASYYAVRATWRLDARIFVGSMFRFLFGFPYARVRDALLRSIHSLLGEERKAT